MQITLLSLAYTDTLVNYCTCTSGYSREGAKDRPELNVNYLEVGVAWMVQRPMFHAIARHRCAKKRQLRDETFPS